jgi:hypothetical protein
MNFFVYVFNAIPSQTSLSVNGVHSRVLQPPPTPGQAPHPYTPFEIQIQRVEQLPDTDIAFLDGNTNKVQIHITGTADSDTATVPLPGPQQPTDDLWLYVFYDLLLLLGSGGQPVAQVPVGWGDSLTAKREAEMSG